MKVLIVPNYARPDALADSSELSAWLDARGIESTWVPDDRVARVSGLDLGEYGLAVSLGGDGTLLRAARTVGYSGVPIVGISYGHLGFLTCAGPEELYTTVEMALAGEMHASSRATLDVCAEFVTDEGEDLVVRRMALNDCALAHGPLGAVVSFDVSVSGNHVDRLRGDGFVVSTATGSTGYALAAGGPIVTPEFGGLVCVPVAPHTIMARAFLTGPSDEVCLAIDPDRPVETCLFADGQTLGAGARLVRVLCRRGANDITLLDKHTQSFYGSVSRVFYGKGATK